jgi:type IX secretion system PorP/SprF family membrane protein
MKSILYPITTEKRHQMKKGLILLVLCLLSLSGYAQHFNFSQYNYTPMRVNPALVATDNNAYAILNYRSQGTSAMSRFNSSMMTATYPLMSAKTNRPWGGVGISALDDRVSEGGMYTSQTLAANFAYNIVLSGSEMISLGVQGNYSFTNITSAGLTTGSQYIANRGFDPSASIGEDLADWQMKRFTLSTGAYWYQLDEYDRKSAYIGLAFRDFNSPNEAFKGQGNPFPSTFLAHAGVRVYEEGRTTITPEVLYTRSASQSLLNLGATMGYSLDDDPSANGTRLDMGARYIVGKAAVLSVQFVKSNYVIGFSYDVPVSASSVSTSLSGAPELVLALKKTIEPREKHKKKKTKKKKKKKNKKKKSKKKKSTKKKSVRKMPPRKAEPKQTPEKPAAPEVTQSTPPVDSLPPVTEKPADLPVAEKETPSVEEKKKEILAKLRNHQFEFDFNRAELNEETRLYLDELALFMRENPDFHLTVTGHTDNVGSARSNQALSRKRAESVVKYLSQQGVEKLRMQAVGKGFDEPLVPNDSPENRDRNRRVAFDLE